MDIEVMEEQAKSKSLPSGAQLMECYQKQNVLRKSPTMKTPKLLQSENEALENAEINGYLSEVRDFVGQPTVDKACNLSQAIWVSDLKCAKVTKKVGKKWNYFGHSFMGNDILYPEEAAYLLEINDMELMHGGIPMSLQKCFALLLTDKNGCCLLEYRVYAHLVTSGYRVFRHDPEFISETPRTPFTNARKEPVIIKELNKNITEPQVVSNGTNFESRFTLEQLKNTQCLKTFRDLLYQTKHPTDTNGTQEPVTEERTINISHEREEISIEDNEVLELTTTSDECPQSKEKRNKEPNNEIILLEERPTVAKEHREVIEVLTLDSSDDEVHVTSNTNSSKTANKRVQYEDDIVIEDFVNLNSCATSRNAFGMRINDDVIVEDFIPFNSKTSRNEKIKSERQYQDDVNPVKRFKIEPFKSETDISSGNFSQSPEERILSSSMYGKGRQKAKKQKKKTRWTLQVAKNIFESEENLNKDNDMVSHNVSQQSNVPVSMFDNEVNTESNALESNISELVQGAVGQLSQAMVSNMRGFGQYRGNQRGFQNNQRHWESNQNQGPNLFPSHNRFPLHNQGSFNQNYPNPRNEMEGPVDSLLDPRFNQLAQLNQLLEGINSNIQRSVSGLYKLKRLQDPNYRPMYRRPRPPNQFSQGQFNNRLPGFNNGPQGFNNGPQGFNNGPQGFNNGPQGFNNGPQGFNNGPQGFNNGPQGFNNGPQGFNNGPQGFNNGPRYNQYGGYNQYNNSIGFQQNNRYPAINEDLNQQNFQSTPDQNPIFQSAPNQVSDFQQPFGNNGQLSQGYQQHHIRPQETRGFGRDSLQEHNSQDNVPKVKEESSEYESTSEEETDSEDEDVKPNVLQKNSGGQPEKSTVQSASGNFLSSVITIIKGENQGESSSSEESSSDEDDSVAKVNQNMSTASTKPVTNKVPAASAVTIEESSSEESSDEEDETPDKSKTLPGNVPTKAESSSEEETSSEEEVIADKTPAKTTLDEEESEEDSSDREEERPQGKGWGIDSLLLPPMKKRTHIRFIDSDDETDNTKGETDTIEKTQSDEELEQENEKLIIFHNEIISAEAKKEFVDNFSNDPQNILDYIYKMNLSNARVKVLKTKIKTAFKPKTNLSRKMLLMVLNQEQSRLKQHHNEVRKRLLKRAEERQTSKKFIGTILSAPSPVSAESDDMDDSDEKDNDSPPVLSSKESSNIPVRSDNELDSEKGKDNGVTNEICDSAIDKVVKTIESNKGDIELEVSESSGNRNDECISNRTVDSKSKGNNKNIMEVSSEETNEEFKVCVEQNIAASKDVSVVTSVHNKEVSSTGQCEVMDIDTPCVDKTTSSTAVNESTENMETQDSRSDSSNLIDTVNTSKQIVTTHASNAAANESVTSDVNNFEMTETTNSEPSIPPVTLDAEEAKVKTDAIQDARMQFKEPMELSNDSIKTKQNESNKTDLTEKTVGEADIEINNDESIDRSTTKLKTDRSHCNIDSTDASELTAPKRVIPREQSSVSKGLEFEPITSAVETHIHCDKIGDDMKEHIEAITNKESDNSYIESEIIVNGETCREKDVNSKTITDRETNHKDVEINTDSNKTYEKDVAFESKITDKELDTNHTEVETKAHDNAKEMKTLEESDNTSETNNHKEQESLLKNETCLSYADVHAKLNIFNQTSPSRELEDQTPLKISFDVYTTGGKNFSKTKRGAPNYRVVVVQPDQELPSPSQMSELQGRYQDTQWVPYLFAVVMPGAVSLYRYSDVFIPCLLDELDERN